MLTVLEFTSILEYWAADHPLILIRIHWSQNQCATPSRIQTMFNFMSQFFILILLLVPIIALSEPEAIQALLRRLDFKRSSASVQEAAAKAVLKRLLPTHLNSFEFKIVSKVKLVSFFIKCFYFLVLLGNFLFGVLSLLLHLSVFQLLHSMLWYYLSNFSFGFVLFDAFSCASKAKNILKWKKIVSFNNLVFVTIPFFIIHIFDLVKIKLTILLSHFRMFVEEAVAFC